MAGADVGCDVSAGEQTGELPSVRHDYRTGGSIVAYVESMSRGSRGLRRSQILLESHAVAYSIRVNDDDFESWVSEQRRQVEQYLTSHGIGSPNVGPWPAFDVAPHFAIWAVQSKRAAGKIGWWAFSGDCPTDYVSEDGSCHPRNALRLLLIQWRECIPYLQQGEQPPHVKFPSESDLAALGALLNERIAILDEWFHDDDLWEDR